MKRTSTSVFRFGSYCQSALISHESKSRECGSHESTRPQSQVLPSSPRSYQRPPTRGSITASTAFALPILWVASGHQVPIFSLGRFLERSVRFAPEYVEPPAKRFEALRVHRVEPARTLGAIHHQSRRLENLQVLRNRGTAHIHPLRDFSHRTGAAAQAL